MAKEKSLKYQLFDAIHEKLSRHQFKLIASKGLLIRRRDAGVSDFFQLVCPLGYPGWLVIPSFGIRIERVEEIFHQISGFEPKYQIRQPA